MHLACLAENLAFLLRPILTLEREALLIVSVCAISFFSIDFSADEIKYSSVLHINYIVW